MAARSPSAGVPGLRAIWHLPGPRLAPLLWCLPALLASCVLAPVIGRGILGDDFGLLALATLAEQPWRFYLEDHSSSYFYRPNGMLTWWLAARSGIEIATAQNLVNLIFHAANASLLALLLARWSRSPGVGILAAAAWAVHPAVSSTPLWLANRFDLSATLGMLGSLHLLETSLRQGRVHWGLPIAAFWAIGSKELAAILPLLVAARVAVESSCRALLRWQALAAAALPVASVLAARTLLIHGVDTTLGLSDHATALAVGTGYWFLRLPEALALAGWAFLPLPLLALASLYAARDQRPISRQPGVAVLVLAMIVLPACVQWPVTQLVLPHPEALTNPANLRFYYFALTGVAALLALLLAAPSPRHRRVVALVTLLGMAAGWPEAWERSRAWAALAQQTVRVADAARKKAIELASPPPCVIRLLGSEGSAPDLRGFLDPATKAGIAPDHPLLDCIVVGEQAPWYALTRAEHCASGQPPLAPRRAGSQVQHSRPVLGFCMHYPELEVPAAAVTAQAQWDATQGVFR